VAVGTAKRSEIVVANYDYWMSINKHATDQPVGQFDLLILDEAHDAPNKLAEFVSISLGKEELRELLRCDLPPLDAGLEYWAHWAKEKVVVCENYYKELRASKNGDVKTIRKLRDLASKLADLGSATRWKRSDPSEPNVWFPGAATDWVAEEYPWGATFAPVWAHGYAERFLFSSIPKVVLTSATIVPQTLSYLGLSPEDFEFNERPSTFPVARRPIYVVNAPSVRYGMSRGEEMVWMNKIDMILSTRLDRKTIIHAVSYDRARFIYENSRHARHMVIHTSRTTAAEVERFRRMAAPAILVSPAVKTGWDFPYDQCDVQIIAKVPFVPMQSAVVKARHKSDKSYVDYLAIMDLIQSAGRGMRAADDHCETFIIDGNIKRLLFVRKTLFPKWFRAAIKRVDTVPDPTFPPRRLTR